MTLKLRKIIIAISLFLIPTLLYLSINSKFVKNIISLEVSKYLKHNYQIAISIGDISFFNFSGELSLHDIKLKFLYESPDTENDIEIKKISVSIGYLFSIFKHITIKDVEIIEPKIRLQIVNNILSNIKIPEDKNQSKKETKPFTLKNLPSIALKNISITDLVIYGNIDKESYLLKTSIEGSLKSLTEGTIKFDFIEIKAPYYKEVIPLRTLELQTSKNLSNLKLNITLLNSEIQAQANIQDINNLNKLEVTGSINLDLKDDLSFIPYANLSKEATLNGLLEFAYKNNKFSIPSIQLTGNKLLNKFFSVDKLDLKASLVGTILNISEAQIRINEGLAKVTGEINLADSFKIHGSLKTENEKLLLNDILQSCNVTKLPLQLPLSGVINFDGQLNPFSLVLDPKLKIPYIKYSVDKNNNFELNTTNLSGNILVNTDYVNFQNVKIWDNQNPNNSHTLEGKIIYSKGYEDLKFNFTNFNLSNITIANKNKIIKGSINLKGGLNGDYVKPTGTVQISGKEINFDNYKIPEIIGNIVLQNGDIDVNNLYIKHLTNIIYLSANYKNNTFFAKVNTNNFKLDYLRDIVPLDSLKTLRGTTDIAFDISYPIKTYDPKFNFTLDAKAISIYKELVKQIKITAKHDNKTQINFNIYKGNGELSGSGSKDQEVVFLNIQSNNLKLEDFSSIPQYITGDINIKSNVMGTINNPFIEGSLDLSNFKISDKPYPDSYLNFNRSNNFFSANGSLLKDKCVINANYKSNSDYNLNVAFNKFDISPILSFVSRSYTSIFGIIDGQLNIRDKEISLSLNDLYVKKDQNSFKLKNSFTLKLSNKKLYLTPLEITGQGFNFILSHEKSILNDIFLIAANLNLSLIYPLIPEIAIAEGNINYNGKLYIDINSNEISRASGLLKLQKIKFILNQLPQAFENINGEITHTLDSLTFSSLIGEFGGGIFKLNGDLSFKDKISADLRFSTQDLTIRYQNFFQAKINSSLDLNGKSGYPLLLKGKIEIPSALVTKKINYKSLIRKSLQGRKSYSTTDVSKKTRYLDLDLNIVGSNLRIANNLADLFLEADINISGDNTKPIVLGSVEAKSGYLNLKDRKFVIKKLKLLFDNKDIIDPSIIIDSESDFKTHLVNMSIKGTPKSDIKINFSSKPSLPEKNILLLISTGSAEGNDEDLAKSELFDLVSEVDDVTAFVEKMTGVDRVKIMPGRFQGKESKRGNFLISAEKNLSDNMILKFSAPEDFSAYKLNLDYYLSPRYRIEAGNESEGEYSSNSVDLIWEKSYK